MKTISLISQSKLTSLRKLLQKKYRERDRKFLIEGPHLIEEALNSDWDIEEIVVTKDFLQKEESGELLQKVHLRNISVSEISGRMLEGVSDTVNSQGVIAVVRIRNEATDFWTRLHEQALIVVLDNISDPGNVGTILRTCDWFGVDAVVLSGNSVDVYNSKVVRASMGAIFHLPIAVEENAISFLNELKNNGMKIYATTLERGESLNNVSFSERNVIVFGNEAHGLSKEIMKEAGKLITIPRYGKAESLNVGVACGVVLGTLRAKM